MAPKKVATKGATDARFNVAALQKKEDDLKKRLGGNVNEEEAEDSEEEFVIEEGVSEEDSDEDSDDESAHEEGDEDQASEGGDEVEDGEEDDESGSEVELGNEAGTDSDGEGEDGDEEGSERKGEAREGETAGSKRVRGTKKQKVRGVLTPEQLQMFKEKAEQTGIIYLSRIPPFMKPIKLRHYFSAYGTIGRIYLQQEDPKARKKRVRFGGSKKKKFTEGWVEFLDKRDAKVVAKTLNNQPVGGQKRSYYAYDLWNIKYLPKFKWHHLTERIAYENAMREKKLQLAVRQATRENNYYLENVAKSRMIQEMEERKKAKRKATGDGETQAPVKRVFKQRKLMDSAE